MQIDLTQGPITKTMLQFSIPMICGNLLQQLYNVVDTLIVGQYLGANALAAVGSAYTLMTFLTSIFLGLCMGSGAIFSIRYGEKNMNRLKEDMYVAFLLTAGLTLLINLFVFWKLDLILHFLSVPKDVYTLMRSYLWAVFWGIVATFLYNYYAAVLRAIGNSLTPLLFLGIGAVTNIGLDLAFILIFHMGVAGAAWATVFAQWMSGIGLLIYTKVKCPWLHLEKRHRHLTRENISEISQASILTCLQQSVMNLGILMVQGLVNRFGTVVMAAFAAAVKIDAFAYMPLQDFGNAFSTFIAQNYGAKKKERIKKGIRSAALTSILFALIVSAIVVICAKPLLLIFVHAQETEILKVGMSYLRIVGAFYCGIGLLFLLYGLYRAMDRPAVSLVLTIISLGTRVVLAYLLSAIPAIGVIGIWWAVPIGWFLADSAGIVWYLITLRKKINEKEVTTYDKGFE